MLSSAPTPDPVPGLGPLGRPDERRHAGLTDTRNAQPALGIAGLADALTRAPDRTERRRLHGGGVR